MSTISREEFEKRYGTEVLKTAKVPKKNMFQRESEGFFGKARDFATNVVGGGKLAEGAGMALASGKVLGDLSETEQQAWDLDLQLIQAIREGKQKGQDTSRLENAWRLGREQMKKTAGVREEFINALPSDKEVVGSAIRLGATMVAPTLAQNAVAGFGSKPAVGLAQGALQGAKVGAISGALEGGLQGAGQGIETGESMTDFAKSTALGTVTGGVAGGVIGGALGGFSGWLQGRQVRDQELKELIESGNIEASNVERAGKIIEDGKVVTDKKGKALLRQGIDEKNVALFESMSDADKAAAKEMTKVAQEASTNKAVTDRPQEIAGQTFMKRMKELVSLNKTAGQNLDDVARNELAGTAVDSTRIYDDFVDDLQRAGVTIDGDKLVFDGSDFDDLGPIQKRLQAVFKRVSAGDSDAFQLHQTKRFIDNQVNYGKSSGGLTGDAENLLKGLRYNIDNTLDTQFTAYNQANTQYADTINAIQEVKRVMGREYTGAENIQNLRAGEVMNRLLGNAQARPLSALQNVETTLSKYGYQLDDSVVKQIAWADMLDDIYEIHPTRGFAGQTKRGIEQAVEELARRRTPTELLIDQGLQAGKRLFGQTPENARKAVEAFIGL